MMKKLLPLKNIPSSRLEFKNHTLFITKTAKKPYLWGCTNLCSQYMEVQPPRPPHPPPHGGGEAKTPILRVRANIMTLKGRGNITFIYSLTKLLHCYVIPYCSFAVCSITRVQTKVVDNFRCQRQRTYVMRRVNTIQYCPAIFKPSDVSQRICIHCTL